MCAFRDLFQSRNIREYNAIMIYKVIGVFLLLLRSGLTSDLTTPAPTSVTVLGNLYRQARSEYYANRYAGDNAPSMSSSVRSDPLIQRDAAYFESRCITCDPSKSIVTDRGLYQPRYRPRTRPDYYDDDLEDRRYRDRNDPYRDRYDPYYERPRGPVNDYDRYDSYGRNDGPRPSYYDRYEPPPSRERHNNRPLEPYDRGYDRPYERGNGYDNLDSHYPYDERSDRQSYKRPQEEPYNPRSHRNRYDRNDPYERSGWRRPYDERNDRYGERGPPSDARGYVQASPWGSGYDRDYASAWNYSGNRDNWRDYNGDRDPSLYRPRDYFYDSTAAPGGLRGTSHHYDRPESSTKGDSNDRDKPTSSPQSQDSKGYKD